ncbi:NAD(P)-binding protein [Croceicoccus sp. BE223]|uniref:NAD(P)-binding protein n=1 Tax=Croceicoccus sp. BE223 TaxID=2817716 RepID=UPI002860C85A|nr:NAD(P)-binding protein [Croceicoccus sp. BE223]MDR7101734.1 2-polyprenyl-6-methoxyphenol hydroxylase-like FAD-dependent oxidoreductase [Croceicoccus sp. BE223]
MDGADMDRAGMDRAIVVGGGIAGLALSLALLRQGRQVLLCEQAAAFAPLRAGITLSPAIFA